MPPVIGILPTTNVQGQEQVRIQHPLLNEIDEKFNVAYTRSTYKKFKKNSETGDIEEVPSPKPSDDNLIRGFTSEGLPFMIAVDGYYGTENPANVFDFTRSQIVPLIGAYVAELKTGEEHTAVSKRLIEKIHQAQKAQNQFQDPAQFTMSLSVCFKKGNEEYVAGFGIGDIGLVLIPQVGFVGDTIQPSQLTYNTAVLQENGSHNKDGFDARFAANPDAILSRADYFMQQIQSGDTVLAYTSLPRAFQGSTVLKGQVAKTPFVLPEGFIPNTREPLATQINDSIDGYMKEEEIAIKRMLVQPDSRFTEDAIGDDCTVGSFSMPSPHFQSIIKVNVNQSMLEEFIEKAIQGIHVYLNRPRVGKQTHLSWSSKYWDSARGHYRARVYLQALTSDALSLEQKGAIIYALLAKDEKAKQLKQDIYSKMQLSSSQPELALKAFVQNAYGYDAGPSFIYAEIERIGTSIVTLANTLPKNYHYDATRSTASIPVLSEAETPYYDVTKKRPVALIDYNFLTLNPGPAGSLGLLEALAAANIHDIFVFVDKSHTQETLVARHGMYLEELRQLSAKGFMVHGILTPFDFANNEGPGAVFGNPRSLQKPAKTSEENTLNYFLSRSPSWIDTVKLVTNNQLYLGALGNLDPTRIQAIDLAQPTENFAEQLLHREPHATKAQAGAQQDNPDLPLSEFNQSMGNGKRIVHDPKYQHENAETKGCWVLTFATWNSPEAKEALNITWERIKRAAQGDAGWIYHAEGSGFDPTGKVKTQTITVECANSMEHQEVFAVYDYLVNTLQINPQYIVGFARATEKTNTYWWNLKEPDESVALKTDNFKKHKENDKKAVYQNISNKPSLNRLTFSFFRKLLDEEYRHSWKPFKNSRILDAINAGELTTMQNVHDKLSDSREQKLYGRTRRLMSKLRG